MSDGEITALIAKRVPHGFVAGINSSEDMIKLAKRNFPAKHHPNLSFLVKDARELDFNEEFDIIFSNACLHWIVNHLPVLEGIKRSLKPSGKVLLQMGGRGNAAEAVEVMESIMEEQKWAKFFNEFSFPYGFYDPEEYRSWLKTVKQSKRG
jgi:trans-aconitate methyltransferase